jgi:hypothetical protein
LQRIRYTQPNPVPFLGLLIFGWVRFFQSPSRAPVASAHSLLSGPLDFDWLDDLGYCWRLRVQGSNTRRIAEPM